MKRNPRSIICTIALMGLCSALAVGAIPAQAADKLDRTVLPIPEPNYPHSTVFDARNATAPPRFEVKAPTSVWMRAPR